MNTPNDSLSTSETSQLLGLLSKATGLDVPPPGDEVLKRQGRAGWIQHLWAVCGQQIPAITEQGEAWMAEQRQRRQSGQPETPFTYTPRGK
jgi:hypothetical protein